MKRDTLRFYHNIRVAHNLKFENYFWNFPLNIFGLWLVEARGYCLTILYYQIWLTLFNYV